MKAWDDDGAMCETCIGEQNCEEWRKELKYWGSCAADKDERVGRIDCYANKEETEHLLKLWDEANGSIAEWRRNAKIIQYDSFNDSCGSCIGKMVMCADCKYWCREIKKNVDLCYCSDCYANKVQTEELLKFHNDRYGTIQERPKKEELNKPLKDQDWFEEQRIGWDRLEASGWIFDEPIHGWASIAIRMRKGEVEASFTICNNLNTKEINTKLLEACISFAETDMKDKRSDAANKGYKHTYGGYTNIVEEALKQIEAMSADEFEALCNRAVDIDTPSSTNTDPGVNTTFNAKSGADCSSCYYNGHMNKGGCMAKLRSEISGLGKDAKAGICSNNGKHKYYCCKDYVDRMLAKHEQVSERYEFPNTDKIY